MTVQLFMSHTRLDKDFCDRFDIVAARVGVKVFRSELEAIERPAWSTIREAIDRSSALFLLVGKELVKAHSMSTLNKKDRVHWQYTQNWISYEVGLACQRRIDVWVICDWVPINFPVPYFNNYTTWGIELENPDKMHFIRSVFETYGSGGSFPVGSRPEKVFVCTSKDCGANFNLHSVIPKGGILRCPTCLSDTDLPAGWLLNSISEPSKENATSSILRVLGERHVSVDQILELSNPYPPFEILNKLYRLYRTKRYSRRRRTDRT